MPVGDLKQEIARINNRVNQSLFGVGLRWQKIDLIGFKTVAIVSENIRVKPLAAVQDTVSTKMIDVALLDEFKARLRRELEETLGLNVETILKDYDPKTQLAGTIIIAKDPLPPQ